MKPTEIKSTAQQLLDAYRVDERKYGVAASLAETCRLLVAALVPHEDIDALPSYKRVAAKQRALTRTQLLCVAWELDRASESTYTEQVVTGEPNE